MLLADKLSQASKDLIFDAATKGLREEQRLLKIKYEVWAESLRPLSSRIVIATSLLVPAEPCIRLVAPKLLLHAPPRLILDEVTKYLSWEETTWRQRLAEEVERALLGDDYGWRVMGIDYAASPLNPKNILLRPASEPNLQNIPPRPNGSPKTPSAIGDKTFGD